LRLFNNKHKKSNYIKKFGEFKSETFLFNWISEYFLKNTKSDYSHLSDKTCNDLDFEELFMFLDRTNSKVGQQYLYYQLRTSNDDDNISDKDEELIQKIEKDEKFRLFLEKQLSKLDQTEAFYIAKLFQDKPIEVPKWHWILPFLSIISLSCVLSLLFSTGLVSLVPVLIIINMGIHYRNKNNLDHYISSIPELLKLHSIAKNLLDYDSNIFMEKEFKQSISVIERVKKHFYLFQLENRAQSDVTNLFWGSLEIIKIILVLEPIMFFKALTKIKTNQKHIRNLYNSIGRLDMLYSISSLRYGADNYCLPNYSNPEDGIKAKGIYHPLIENCV